MGGIKIPDIPMPKQARVEVLHKAIWDYLRTGLSFDQATAVKHDAEEQVRQVLDALIVEGKQ